MSLSIFYYVCHRVSETCAETSQSDFGYFICAPTPRLIQTSSSHLFFNFTTSFFEVYQINSLILTYYPLHGKSILKIWISYCTSGHNQPDKTNDSSTNPSRTLLPGHDSTITSMDIGYEETTFYPTLKDNSLSLLELKTCCENMFSSVTNQKCIDL